MTPFQVWLTRSLFAAGTLTAGMVPASSVLAWTDDQPKTSESEKGKSLVQAAMQAEIEGEAGKRAELLKQAESLIPKDPSVHWLQGEIQAGRNWKSYESTVEQAKKSKALEEYRKLRDASKPTVESQLELISFCKKHSLEENAIAHWSAILELDPNHESARKQLGYTLTDDGWMLTKELEKVQQSGKRIAKLLATKSNDLTKLADQLRLGEISQEKGTEIILQDAESDIIPIWERCLSSAHRQGALVVIEALSKMSQPEATLSLARHAVWADDVHVRVQASEFLKSRDEQAYIPQMLGQLQGPWILARPITFQDSNRLVYRYAMISDGKDRQALRMLDDTYFLNGDLQDANRQSQGFTQSVQSRGDSDRRSANAAITASNERIMSALKTITGQEELKSPQDWWAWWDDRIEVYSTGEKPIETSYSFSRTEVEGSRTREIDPYRPRVIAVGPVRTRCECLAAGTPILTQRGPVAIERVRIGDLVLAQHPNTGEVRYEPVLRTTIREPSHLIRIRLEGDSKSDQASVIRASGGHPFWVSGKGWVRARDLEPGMRLHGLQRFTTVQSTEVEEKLTRTFNLVVHDYHSYFVGKEAILTHDNSVVQPIRALVPGLLDKELLGELSAK